ncbi:MAG: FtsH protease activity modulator HflK [Burkholderiaceae bacterium]
MNMSENTRPCPPPIGAAASLRRLLLRKAFGRLLAQGQDGGPPDIDEMWRDFTGKLSSFFGLSKKGGEPGPGGGFQPDARSAGIGAALIAGVVVVIWLFSGSFIVQEGQRSVVTTFGKYSHTVGAGWGWRLPYPIQANETIDFTQLKTAEIGGTSISPATGLRDSAMLTQDENIVDIRFNVQYSLKDARDFLFSNRDPGVAVVQASESAVREIVGRSRIDSVLYQQRDALAASLIKSIQAQLDRLKAGILIANVNIENVVVPEQVTTAFNDVVKAGVDRDRLKNEGQAYANHVIPAAQGDAARLREDALSYKARIVGAAEGDSDRFKAIYAEYQKAPGVTRDRMYIDAMQDVYSNVTKVMVDTHGGANLIQLPIDKLVQAAAANAAPSAAQAGPSAGAGAAGAESSSPPLASDPRARDNARGRDREGR